MYSWKMEGKMFHRLEEHLKEVSEQYKEYENLYASWCLNKKACV